MTKVQSLFQKAWGCETYDSDLNTKIYKVLPQLKIPKIYGELIKSRFAGLKVGVKMTDYSFNEFTINEL